MSAPQLLSLGLKGLLPPPPPFLTLFTSLLFLGFAFSSLLKQWEAILNRNG